MNDPIDVEVRDVIAAWSGSGWGHGLWFLVFPLFWITVIAAVAFLFGRRRRRQGSGGSGGAVLEERYARGEITEEEYRRRIAVLREGSR